jgi:hypothetical protein
MRLRKLSMSSPSWPVLLITARGASAWTPGASSPSAQFDRPQDEAFSAWLRTPQDLRLIVDCAQESFVHETAPALRGRDRRLWCAKKSAQLSVQTPYAACLTPHRAQCAGAKVVFCALHGFKDDIAPWLAAIEASPTRLAGIFSAAQLIETLWSRTLQTRQGVIDQPEGLLLLRSMGQAGERLSLLRQGRLQYSRLTPRQPVDSIPDAQDKERPGDPELERVRAYLISRQWVSRDEPLPCHDLAAPAQAVLWGWTQAPDDLSIDALLVWCLRHARRGAINFAPPSALRAYRACRRHRLWRRAALWSTVVAGVLCLGLLWHAHQLHDEAQAYEQRAQALEQRTQKVLAQTHQHDAAVWTAADVRALALEIEALRLRQQGPGELLHALALALDEYPEMTIKRLRWENDGARIGSREVPRLDVWLLFKPAIGRESQASGLDPFRSKLHERALRTQVWSDDNRAHYTETTSGMSDPGALAQGLVRLHVPRELEP